MEATVPRLEARLPDLHEFVRTLARQIEGSDVRDGDTLVMRFRDFYTDARMAAIDAVLPGWQEMAAYASGATLHHVTQALRQPESADGSQASWICRACASSLASMSWRIRSKRRRPRMSCTDLEPRMPVTASRK
jgi:hypothetical protein